MVARVEDTAEGRACWIFSHNMPPFSSQDVPFQLVYQRHYHQPLLTKAVVLAHDVDDFSKIWQAMGRSRTMNDTGMSLEHTFYLPRMLIF